MGNSKAKRRARLANPSDQWLAVERILRMSDKQLDRHCRMQAMPGLGRYRAQGDRPNARP